MAVVGGMTSGIVIYKARFFRSAESSQATNWVSV